MRLVLLFLKSAQKVVPLEEVVEVGVNFADKILESKPWTASPKDASSSFWPNLKRGLCFFAAEYHSKSPKAVASVFRKHLVAGGDNGVENGATIVEQGPIHTEFCEESPILKEILAVSQPVVPAEVSEPKEQAPIPAE